MALWIYHMESGSITQAVENVNLYGFPAEVVGGYEEVIRSGGIHPQDIEAYRTMYQAIDRGQETSECTVRVHLGTDDKYEWRHMILTRFQEAGEAPIAIGFGVNVELQKEAEIRYERESRLRKEILKDAVIYYRINLDTRMVEELYSEAMDTSWIQLPTAVDELENHGLFDGCYPQDKEFLMTMLNVDHMKQNYETGKREESFVYRRYMPGKGLRWLKASIAKLKRVTSDDTIAFFTAVDIDEDKKDQMLYKDVMDEEIESLITLKIKSGQIRILKEDRPLCGYDPKKPTSGYIPLTGDFYDSLFQDMVEEDISAAMDFIDVRKATKALETKKVLQSTYRTRMADGSLRRKKVRIFYLDESKEDLIYVRRDITDLYNEQQRQSAAIRHAMNEARTANEAKSAFLSRMSHDMRTPLNAIIGYSGKELREGATEQQKDGFLDDIHSSGEYLLGIINDVLDMTKIESNKMVLHPERYTFQEFRDSVETVIMPLCEKKGIRFEVAPSEHTDAPLLLDKVRFNQIFINILSNAVKFTPSGGTISMSATCIGETDEGMNMEFIVSDTGCGMSKEFLPHAFDNFSQEYEAQSMHKEQGTGLGLSIVKQLVELMDGTIRVESELGKGTTFTISLPVKILDDDNRSSNHSVPAHGLNGYHILLCEDHPMNSKIAVRLLEKEGCIVDTAENGKAGVDKFCSSDPHTFDAILMDIQMPVMDGLEATRAIRRLSREDAASVPIIAMTANAFVEDQRDCMEAGMNAHISKPIDTTQMYQTIYQYVSQRHVIRTPKVLVVDDVEVNACVVSAALADQYETMTASNGKQALEELKNNPYIIAVVTDIQMPEMDGVELIRAIRNDPAYNRVALIANTEFGDSNMEEMLLGDGADDFIYKPTAPSLIRARVNSAIAKHR